MHGDNESIVVCEDDNNDERGELILLDMKSIFSQLFQKAMTVLYRTLRGRTNF